MTGCPQGKQPTLGPSVGPLMHLCQGGGGWAQSHGRHSQLEKGVQGREPALGHNTVLIPAVRPRCGLGGQPRGERFLTRTQGHVVGRYGNGLGLWPGIRLDSRSAKGRLALQGCTPMWPCGRKERRRCYADCLIYRTLRPQDVIQRS